MNHPHSRPWPALSRELGRHTLESLYAGHGGHRPWTYWCALIGCIAILASLPFVEVDVAVQSAGVVKAAGPAAGEIAFAAAPVIEAVVSPGHIAMLRPGQPARVQIDAFPFRQWGVLDGTVASIGADYTRQEDGSGFTVVVHAGRSGLQLPNGAIGRLRQGMTATVRFVVARKSLLQLLYDNAPTVIDPRPPG